MKVIKKDGFVDLTGINPHEIHFDNIEEISDMLEEIGFQLKYLIGENAIKRNNIESIKTFIKNSCEIITNDTNASLKELQKEYEIFFYLCTENNSELTDEEIEELIKE